MFRKIMVPIDLTHADRIGRAVDVATQLARQWDAPITFVGATASTPGPIAHNPQEYARKLADYARGIGTDAGVRADSLALTLTDPAVELDHALLDAARDMDADLVVMASHIPGLADRVWPSHGGKLARNARASVFVVRPES